MPSPVSILVVDDDKVAADLISEALIKEGYRVVTTTKGQEAILLGKSIMFDIVITDLKMPGVDGLSIVRTFKKMSPQTLVIVMTAFGSVESALETIHIGAYNYISKPFKLEELRHSVRSAALKHPILPRERLICKEVKRP